MYYFYRISHKGDSQALLIISKQKEQKILQYLYYVPNKYQEILKQYDVHEWDAVLLEKSETKNKMATKVRSYIDNYLAIGLILNLDDILHKVKKAEKKVITIKVSKEVYELIKSKYKTIQSAFNAMIAEHFGS